MKKVAITVKAKQDKGMIRMLKSSMDMLNLRAQVTELDTNLFVIFGKDVKKLKDLKNPLGKLLLSYGLQPSVEYGDYEEQPAMYVNMTGKATVKYVKPPLIVKTTLDPWVDWGKTPSYFASSDQVEKAIRKLQSNPEIISLVKNIRSEDPKYGFTNGSCITFAKILQKVFGGEIWFLACFDPEDDGWCFQHAYVKIGSNFYDGSGRISEEMILEKYADKSLENKVGPASLWSPQLDYLLKLNHDGFLTYAEIRMLEQCLEEASAHQKVN